MGFHQLRAGLAQTMPEAEKEEINFQEVEQLTKEHFADDDVIYFEVLNENYHRESIAAFAWGNSQRIFVSENQELLKDPLFKTFLAKPMATYDFKRAKVLLSHLEIAVPAVPYDARLANYLLSNVEDNELETIARLHTTMTLASDEAVYGKGVKRAFPEKAIFLDHLARKVKVLVDSRATMLAKLEEHQQSELFTDIELPLANVLAKMEIAGIKVNKESLVDMAEQNKIIIESLTQEIYEMAGEEFNINSPKQLGVILFEKMQLPLEMTKKTKTGYSTAVDVLERLAPIAPIVAKILDYRQITKLQSTYVIGLQDYIMSDGKIHTRYVQDLTQTGRLSSSDPNLQNIPVRLEQGRLIRKAFTASKEVLFC